MTAGHFYVLSPLQYVCALEARSHYQLQLQEAHLLIGTTRPTVIRQLNRIVEDDRWDSIIYLETQQSSLRWGNRIEFLQSTWSARKFAASHLLQVAPSDYVFVGNIADQLVKWIVANTRANNRVVLDDGFSTVAYLNRRGFSSLRFPRSKVELVNLALFPNSQVDPRTLTFFSVFDGLDFSPSEYVGNDFACLKGRYLRNDYVTGKYVAFIGQPVSEAGVMSRQIYWKIVDAFYDSCHRSGNAFEYYAHRAEVLERLPARWNAKAFDFPVEISFLHRRNLPQTTYSLYSTALLNLRNLFGDQLNVAFVKPPTDTVANKHKRDIAAIYRYIEEKAKCEVERWPGVPGR